MNSQPSTRFIELIDSLLTKTRSKAIYWEPTDLPGAFFFVAPSGSIVIERGEGAEDGAIIRVLDATGAVVEEQFEAAAGPVSSLHSLIEQQLRGGDRLLESLLAEVRSA